MTPAASQYFFLANLHCTETLWPDSLPSWAILESTASFCSFAFHGFRSLYFNPLFSYFIDHDRFGDALEPAVPTINHWFRGSSFYQKAEKSDSTGRSDSSDYLLTLFEGRGITFSEWKVWKLQAMLNYKLRTAQLKSYIYGRFHVIMFNLSADISDIFKVMDAVWFLIWNLWRLILCSGQKIFLANQHFLQVL